MMICVEFNMFFNSVENLQETNQCRLVVVLDLVM